MEKTGTIKIGTVKIGFLPNNSKQLIGVANDYKISHIPEMAHLWIENKGSRLRFIISNDRKCKAKIEGNKAIITEIIKRKNYKK